MTNFVEKYEVVANDNEGDPVYVGYLTKKKGRFVFQTTENHGTFILDVQDLNDIKNKLYELNK